MRSKRVSRLSLSAHSTPLLSLSLFIRSTLCPIVSTLVVCPCIRITSFARTATSSFGLPFSPFCSFSFPSPPLFALGPRLHTGVVRRESTPQQRVFEEIDDFAAGPGPSCRLDQLPLSLFSPAHLSLLTYAACFSLGLIIRYCPPSTNSSLLPPPSPRPSLSCPHLLQLSTDIPSIAC